MKETIKNMQPLHAEINQAAALSKESFDIYKNSSLKKRSELLHGIAAALKENESSLIETAAKETRLSPARLKTEFDRTIFQLRSYGDHCAGGQWLDARIDTPTADRPQKRDVRKTMIPLGPVVVFGASNFPFAYSTPGGDTASALAAGCTVIVKAHPAHPEISEYCASLISKAVRDSGLPGGVFTHIQGESFETGEYLVKHPLVKAVGFTGSFSGGKQLFDWANNRKEPIPVFAEMGSTNPVFMLPSMLEREYEKTAEDLFNSITLSMGQFCTKPGLIIGIESEGLEKFTCHLSKLIENCRPEPLLHEGILDNFNKNKAAILSKSSAKELSISKTETTPGAGIPSIAQISATDFIRNPDLHREVFGPFSLIIPCRDIREMQEVAKNMEGQLTATLIGSSEELQNNLPLLESLKMIAGRIIINGVPTGVEVCLSMHHGGPYPATTDSRFTSVGADSIKRFVRPVSFQNWPNELLPDELKNDNPLNIWRTVNDVITQDAISLL